MTSRRLLHAALALLALNAHAGADAVVRRGGALPKGGHVQLIDDAGVHVRDEGGTATIIPWDRVRAIEADGVIVQREYGLRRDLADDLWRARSRVERGDGRLAEPLFDRWLERYLEHGNDSIRTSETALVVAEGLLRCRLARGAQEAAVIPALEVARLRRAGVQTESYGMLPAVIDENTWLCPYVPPAWVQRRAMLRLERDLKQYDHRGDEIVAALAGLYLQAVRRQLGREGGEGPADAASGPGIELLAMMVETMGAGEAERRSTRADLARTLPRLEPWAEAWGRYGVGISLLLESGFEQREQGLVSLAHVPARFGRRQPYLAGLALARMASILEEDGRVAEAVRLQAELARRYPQHPVRQTDGDGRHEPGTMGIREDL